MYPLNHTPPDKMTPSQRCSEVACLLANGLIRLREQPVAERRNNRFDKGFGLGFGSQQSVHTHRTIPSPAEHV